ncbi:MAG: addiction module protein [Polaromonas sp.]
MKSTLQPVEHLGKFERLQLAEDLWDEFAAETGMETRPEVLDELERRAAWRNAHPGQGKSLAQIAQSLGVRL